MIDKNTQSYTISCWFDKMALATRVCRGWGSRSWTRASSCWKKLVWQLVSFQWLRRKIYSLLHNYYPSSPNILNCRKSSPDQPVKEVKKFWGPVQILLHCESAKLMMDGASEADFFMGTVPQLEPATLQPFSQCVRMCYLIFTGPVPGDEPWLIFPLPSHLDLLLMPLAVAPQPDIRQRMIYFQTDLVWSLYLFSIRSLPFSERNLGQ